MSLHSDEVVLQGGTAAVTQGTSPWVVSGSVTTTPPTSSSCSITQVIVPLNTNTQLLASNVSRKGVIIYIPLGGVYVKLGITASTTSFTYLVNNNETMLEIPFGWTGEIDIYGTAQTITITELS